MNALGQKKLHKSPQYTMDKIGRVTSAADYKTKARIEVEFLDHGKCMPVWVVGDVDREPMPGDMVVIGYMEGRKDCPYLRAFVRNESYTANYIEVGLEYIRFQLPKNKDDREKSMNDDSLKSSRVYIELNASGIALYHPDGDVFLNAPKGNVNIISKTGTQTF
jgi:hypothetical protein